LTLLIGGDCGPVHGKDDGYPIEGYTELLRPVLDAADMRFANCMRTYSTRGEQHALAPQVRQPVEMADIFTHGRFDVVTMANNHSYDSGPEAMLDTRALFESRGIKVAGVGKNLAQAREPAVVERNGLRVGYLGYCSVGRPESAAGADKPGIATLRVNTQYETRGPHEPVRILTTPDVDDLAMLVADITALRQRADVVILAFHSGVIRLPRVIPDYQVAVSHAAIDAGADLVVSHGPHIPKAIESYKGKAIFYSLGVFAMTKPFSAPAWHAPAWQHGAVRNHIDLDPDYPLMPYGRDCTRALLVKAVVSKRGITRVSFLPMMFDHQYRPQALSQGDARFADVVKYMEWASEDMPHTFRVEGDEVVIG
jgi:poly-gamma-glutamate synthesis protein (capsule biosynthesis protein)